MQISLSKKEAFFRKFLVPIFIDVFFSQNVFSSLYDLWEESPKLNQM